MVQSFQRKWYNLTEQHEVLKVESTEEEQADQFDSACEEEDNLLQTSTVILPTWTKGIFSLSVVRRDSAGQSKLIQGSS